MKKQLILPSVMAQNQDELNADLKKLFGVVKIIHLDIVDGLFAPSRALDFNFKLSSGFTYEAHLMVKDPLEWIKKNGHKVNLCIPHFEEFAFPEEYLSWAKQKKKKVAFAIKPETLIKAIAPYLKETDYLLILTVNPGYYGSKFLPQHLKKIKQAKEINPRLKVIVDGGMNPMTINRAFHAGADYFVSGSFTTKSENPSQAIKQLIDMLK